MPLLTVSKALRVRKTPAILEAILEGVSHERAASATDGPDGWSVLFIVCHMRDYEDIFFERATHTLEQDFPTFPPPQYNNDEMAVAHRYAEQKLDEVLADFKAKRARFVAFLEKLTPDQWHRGAAYPQVGEASLRELAINVTLHDVDHLEQILQALNG